MNGYVCFFNGQRFECHAETIHDARDLAQIHFNPSKRRRHMIAVMLAEKDGEQVTHVAQD